MDAAYTTAAESQVHLASKADWLALADADQDTWLEWGRAYIDDMWTCLDADGDEYDDTTAPEALKHANSLLGYLAFTDVLFSDAPRVKSVEVEAGSVRSAKTYSSGYVEENSMHKQASILLAQECVKASKSGYTRALRA